MAGGEIYRVEIPIIVDDQTDKPLQQAEQKISKLEQHARKENERMRQHFMKIARLQIEPVMKVRDHLTSGVLKADRLIRKLDMAQASPLIAAQDRVSAVVTRTNAMLDALDKGKVDVAAEMKGPLLDEIVKAKSALAVLNNVKAGPVAELRGELFGQLTKAMSQIRGLDLSRAEPQATLRERVTMKVREIGSSLRSLTTRAWAITLQVKDKVTGAIKSIASSAKGIISKLTSPLALLGAGAGVGAGIIFPLKLAGEFEQAQMSLDFYMGSVEEGKKAFEDLVRFAKETPFEFPFLQGATIQLMGAGYNFEQAKRALLAFGDAAGRTGAGMQGIEAALVGFTQIASAGTLNLQDLKQVALNLKLPLNIFAKELGVAESKLGDIGRAGISSQKAMEAIVRTLEKRFAGGMKELSNSLLGMTAVIKDTANLTVWHFGKGMAGPVKRILLDIVGLTENTGGKFEEFQRKLERVGEQVGLKFEQVYNRIKEFWNNLSADPEFQKLDFGDKLIYILNLALDKVDAWLDGEGSQRLLETFSKISGIIVKAWHKGMTNLGERTIQELKEGDIKGALVPAAIMWMMGGGALAKGAWGLGKGIFKAGKWVLGKLGLGTAGTAATGAATTGAVGVLGKALSTGGILAGVAGVISGAYDIYQGYKETDYEEARKRYWAGGTKIGMVGTGAAIGTAITPGVGTAVGAGIAGIIALLGGTAVGETLRNVWSDFLSWGSKAWDTVGTWASNTWNDVTTWASNTWNDVTTWASGAWEKARKSASSAWNWIKENFTLESIAEKAGYVAGYLESTIFSGEWWGRQWDKVKNWASEKWASMVEVYESAKATIMSTIFSSRWWQGHWDAVKGWTAEKWASVVEIWENTKETLSSTLFSSEWWQGHWQSVKDWTSEKWDEMKTVWETVKNSISSTLFSKTWWKSKWENVKTWTSGVLDNITARWESIKESFQAGREAGRAAATHAVGGILTHPHLGLVAEAGPEAIIPLSVRMRPRALELWQQTGELLGVMPHANGGIFGNVLGGVRNVWNKTKMLFKSDRVSSITNTTESAAIALESTRKGQELITRSIKNYEKKLQKTRTIEETEKVRGIAHEAKSLVRRYGETTKAFARVALPLSLFVSIAEIMGPSDKRQAIIKELGSILGAIGTGTLVGAGTGALVGAGAMSPVTAMLGTILGAGVGAFGGQAAASALYDRLTPHTTGGILTRPHLGLVAEAGPEAIIPLSTRMRARAMDLWLETGRRLGVRPYAEGGLVGTMTEGWREKIPVSFTPSLATPGPATVNLNFDLTGLVRQVVIEKREDIDDAIDKITDAIANNLREVFQNMIK